MMRLAGCVIPSAEQDSILLIHRSTPEVKQWELPGGKIEANEHPAEAAARELFEELKLNAFGLRLVGETDFLNGEIPYNYKWYLPAHVVGNPVPQEPKHDKVAYYPLDKIKGRRFTENVRALTKRILNGTVEL